MNIEKNIVVPGRPALDNGLAVKPFRQIHLHSTGNVNATIDNEATYLSTHYGEAYYTHLVGQGRVMQVANTNGGAYDVGGDWNWEAYAAIEFSEKVANQAEFNKSYKLYIELARALAKEAGITDFTLDTSGTAGIKTHNYASKTGHGSDHTDPLAFLAKWGISYDQLKHDIKYGFETTTVKEDSKVFEKVSNAYYKQGDKVMVKGSKSSYGSPASTYVKQATGTIMAIGARPDKKPGYMYLVNFVNAKTGYDAIWHFNGEDLKRAK